MNVPVPESPVLSTLHEDGRRRWLYPRVSPGRFHARRRLVAWVLIAVFTLLPYLRIQGQPAILLDIPAREFTLFGFTFLPTDTLLLALFLVTLILTIFLATALCGRVWCGWMCPQTVYTEFVYRPLERLCDGPPGPRHAAGTRATPGRKAMKYAIYLAISAFLAHTFLAYFVGVEQLAQWIRRSPVEHLLPFLVMVAVTAAMMFDFSYFREQTCIVACPYGRFQSVMLDRDSLIVSYDPQRGEPRGKGRRVSPEGIIPLGDCIDCGRCVDTCPTGIDIRDGLQMECIACTQCIDACDRVMDKLGKLRGLVRFGSQARIAGAGKRLLRTRVILYPALIVVLLTAFGAVLGGKQSADVTLLRGLGQPYTEQAGEVTNQIRVKVRNRSGRDQRYTVRVESEQPAQLQAAVNPMPVAAGQSRTEFFFVKLPASSFQSGRCDIRIRVQDEAGFDHAVNYRLLGP